MDGIVYLAESSRVDMELDVDTWYLLQPLESRSGNLKREHLFQVTNLEQARPFLRSLADRVNQDTKVV